MLDKTKKFFKSIQLKNKQRAVTKEYERDGLTENVLEQQVQINTERHELDLPDSDNFVFDGFVQ